MIDDAERAARLQHRVHLAKGLQAVIAVVAAFAHPPVMDIAEGEDDVRRAVRDPAAGAVKDREGRIADAAVEIGIGGGEGAQPIVPAIAHRRRVIGAVIAQIGRENLGIPTAARPDFHHRVGRPHAEEGERLGRMAIAVARDVGGGARRRGDGRGERRIGCRSVGVGGLVGEAGRGCEREEQSGGEGVADHLRSLSWAMG